MQKVVVYFVLKSQANTIIAYSDMLIKAKPLLEAETVGTSSLALQKPKDSSSDVNMFRSIMN